jgi:hypothetical protein
MLNVKIKNEVNVDCPKSQTLLASFVYFRVVRG